MRSTLIVEKDKFGGALFSIVKEDKNKGWERKTNSDEKRKKKERIKKRNCENIKYQDGMSFVL